MISSAVISKNRDFYFDNLKVTLITLVVLAHFGEMYARIRSMHSLFNVLSSFLMPVFIFVSGYFSKSIVSQRKTDLLKILLPYFLLQIYHLIFTKITGLGTGSFNIAIPTFQNWYLLGLFMWRLLIPYFSFFNRAASILTSFLISLSIGFIPQFNKFLGLHRAIYFMAFFVLGYFAPDIKQLLKRFNKYRIICISIFFCIILAIMGVSFLNPHLSRIITYAFNPVFGYHEMGLYSTESFYPFITRVVGMIGSIIISWLFLYLIPTGKTWYSKFGVNTLYVFLFHMFIVWPLAKISYKPLLTELGIVILSAAISYFLSQRCVVKILKVLASPWYLFNTPRSA